MRKNKISKAQRQALNVELLNVKLDLVVQAMCRLVDLITEDDRDMEIYDGAIGELNRTENRMITRMLNENGRLN